MPLANGTKLGSFEILAPIGAGGMGEVYRARDEKLGRLVAIKVLPDAFAQQADRRARFEREAKLLASLNHPNVAAIYGLERSGETHYLVLELVEGETLGERIARSSIPVAEAVEIARQIAEGLEEAHERGVVHRDLKPGNVKLAPDGKVKVLDFGLAKAWMADASHPSGSTSDLSQSPTFARVDTGTEAGVILGTPAYMSPEQARGKEIDRRSDIWAFGVLLWEMLTGRKLFEGETTSDVLAAVLTREVDWNAVPKATPPALRRLLARALERNPRKRLQAIGEARLLLEGSNDEHVEAILSTGRRRPMPLVLGVGIALLSIGVGWLLHSSTPAAEPAVRKVDLSIFDLDVEERPVISPDGSRVAFVAGDRLRVRDLTRFEAVEIPDTSDARYLFWSPDGAELGYVADGRAWKVTVGARAGGTGGPSIDLGAVPDDLGGSGGGAWTDDGRIVLVGSDTVGIWEIPAKGGSGKEILQLDRETEADFHEIAALPDGLGLVFTVHRSDASRDTIELFAGGVRRTLLKVPGDRLRHPSYSGTGHLIYERETTNPGIWAVPFSLDRLETTGAPFLLVAGSRAPSEGGRTLAFVRADESPVELLRVRRDGRIESSATITKSRYRGVLSLSPDGRRVAVNVPSPDGQLWIHEIERGSLTRLATDVFGAIPVWTPNGDEVIYASARGARSWNLTMRRADAAEPEERLSSSEEAQMPVALSPDGRWLVYTQPSRGRLVRRPFEGPGEEEVLFPDAAAETTGSFSPDGRWLAYVSDATGRNEVYVRSFPDGSERFPVSTEGGSSPVWCANGEIFYISNLRLYAATVGIRGTGLEISKPTELFELDSNTFDVAADGQTFFTLRSNPQERLSLILDWPSELAEPGTKAR